MSEMRSLITVVLVAVAAALSASAQRGGPHGGGMTHSVGVTNHSGFSNAGTAALHGGTGYLGRNGFAGPPQGHGRSAGSVPRRPIPPHSYREFSLITAPIIPDVAPVILTIAGPISRCTQVGILYGVAVWLAMWTPAMTTQPTSALPTKVSRPQRPTRPVSMQNRRLHPRYKSPWRHLYRPAYQRPQPDPEPENPVTLVFKDGRPTEQIQDYILTRTTLYVQDKHSREIPVADLDMAETERVNKEAGVDFRLPSSAR